MTDCIFHNHQATNTTARLKHIGLANVGNKSFPLPGAPKNHDRALSIKTGMVCWVMNERQGIINVGDGVG